MVRYLSRKGSHLILLIFCRNFTKTIIAPPGVFVLVLSAQGGAGVPQTVAGQGGDLNRRAFRQRQGGRPRCPQVVEGDARCARELANLAQDDRKPSADQAGRRYHALILHKL